MSCVVSGTVAGGLAHQQDGLCRGSAGLEPVSVNRADRQTVPRK